MNDEPLTEEEFNIVSKEIDIIREEGTTKKYLFKYGFPDYQTYLIELDKSKCDNDFNAKLYLIGKTASFTGSIKGMLGILKNNL